MTVRDLVTVLFLACYLCGPSMVAFDSQLMPHQRPAYTRLGHRRKIAAGALWPIVAYLKVEAGWHAVIYASSVPVVALWWYLTGLVIGSELWKSILVMAISLTPLAGLPRTLIATCLWLWIAKPLGARAPLGVA